jgi:hypothetical protein
MDRRKFVEISSLILPGFLAKENLKSKYLVSLFDDPTAISSPGQLGKDFRWGDELTKPTFRFQIGKNGAHGQHRTEIDNYAGKVYITTSATELIS